MACAGVCASDRTPLTVRPDIWVSKHHPLPPTPPFMAAESILKTLKIVNFTNTNAILIKLTTDTYLKKVFHFPKCWGVTHRV